MSTDLRAAANLASIITAARLVIPLCDWAILRVVLRLVLGHVVRLPGDVGEVRLW